MSDDVERRLLELLDHPRESPFGNPIPGLSMLDPSMGPDVLQPGLPLSDYAGEESRDAIVVRLAEPLQADQAVLAALHRVGAVPGHVLRIVRSPGGVRISAAGESMELPDALTHHVIVAHPQGTSQ